jgi:hypothetical protein
MDGSSEHPAPIEPEDLDRATQVGGRKDPLLHPLAGLWMIGLDLMLFGGTVATGGFGLPVTMAVGLALGGFGTYLIQDHYTDDTGPTLLKKAVFGGVVVGAPLPIAGTAAGSVVLAISGLSWISRKLLGRSVR